MHSNWLTRILLSTIAVITLACGTANAQTPGVASGDFNGDGFDDLAVPIPNQDVGLATDAGAVQIIYGSATGLTATGNKVLNQNKSGIASDAQALEHFASTLAAGDFNGDGFDDLAVGVPNQAYTSFVDAGAVHILFGTANGLKGAGSQYWTQESPNILNKSKAGDLFGTALIAGDFDGDGFADLAIGAPGDKDKATGSTGAGAVNVLYGSAGGLISAGNQFWNLSSAGIPDDSAVDDHFGYIVSSGDFNGDGFDDLAVDAPGKTVNAFTNAGSVTVIYGSAAGLNSAGSQTWNQDSTDFLDDAEMSDQFGSALTAGDFNNDGFDDLVCGAAEDSIGAVVSAGVVHVIHGSAAGLTDVGNQLWTQDTGTVLDAVETGDAFGSALAAGDFNDDGYCDLVIGAPGESTVSGAVNMILGSVAGLTDVGSKYFDQSSPGMLGDLQTIAAFGYTLCVGQFDADNKFDLAIGIPFKDVDGVSNCGAVQVLYGNPTNTTGLGIPNNQIWHKNTDGIPGECAMNEFFGGL